MNDGRSLPTQCFFNHENRVVLAIEDPFWDKMKHIGMSSEVI